MALLLVLSHTCLALDTLLFQPGGATEPQRRASSLRPTRDTHSPHGESSSSLHEEVRKSSLAGSITMCSPGSGPAGRKVGRKSDPAVPLFRFSFAGSEPRGGLKLANDPAVVIKFQNKSGRS